MELRYRLYAVNVHDYCQKCAVVVEQEGVNKIEGMTYLSREEFDKVEGYMQADDHIPGIKPTVKFFGEMQWQGHSMVSTNRTTNANQTEYAHKCSNPSCNHEAIALKQYPFIDQVEGRIVKHPGELAEVDAIVNQKLKAHVGSAVVPGAEIKAEDA